jgi:tetratricopeptide (TPR) repeat protein
MDLFHHIVAYRLNEREKQAFMDAKVEFTRIFKVPDGETVIFEIGEADSRWGRVEALLRSLGDCRVRDTTMTVPTFSEYILKVLRPGVDEMIEKRGEWEIGRDVTLKSGELVRTGKPLEALDALDTALRQATAEGRTLWVTSLCERGRAFAHVLGDHEREIGYVEYALPFSDDYPFAAYNLARLLLQHGQADRALHYAAEAYRLSIADEAESNHHLRAAILKQWPECQLA